MVRGIIIFTVMVMLACWIRYYKHLPREDAAAAVPEIHREIPPGEDMAPMTGKTKH